MPIAAISARTNGSAHGFQQLPSDQAGLLASLYPVASITRWGRGREIAIQGGAHECWHQIIRGAARQCASRSDGQRQIIDFLLPGNVLVQGNAREESVVEAIGEDTIVAAFPRHDVEEHASANSHFAVEFRDLTLAGAFRLQRQILIFGRPSAVKKVGAFILDMADRLSDDSPRRVHLPMSRYDIADYLVMSVETVSRSLTSLRSRGAIRFSGHRDIIIVDRAALEEGGSDVHWACSPWSSSRRSRRDAMTARRMASANRRKPTSEACVPDAPRPCGR